MSVRAALLGLALAAWSTALRAETVYVARVDDTINVAVADYLTGAIARAEAEGAAALVIELDTPGGLLSATKEIVAEILNAGVPVVVYVSPRGAWAASAGTFITLAGHVAAMAPGTSIGAAHPVFEGQGPTLPPLAPGEESDSEKERREAQRQARDYMNEKAENFTAAFIESIAEERGRNVEWAVRAVRDSVAIRQSEAVANNVVDLVAENMDDLLTRIDGRTVAVEGEPVVLRTREARRVDVPMTAVQKFVAFLSIPQVAVLLVLGALAGLYAEVQNPGMIVPGVIGATCLVLLGLSLRIIPFNWVGLLLIVAGIGLLIAELFVTSFGLLLVAGAICFGLGAYLTFRVPEVSDLALPLWSFVAPLTAVLVALGLAVVWAASRTLVRPQYSGREALIGQVGRADSDLAPEGRVLLRGELWNARADAPIERGEPVEVVDLANLVLLVRRTRDASGGRA
jgi:membrane-bound serine protease (ClpP class)